MSSKIISALLLGGVLGTPQAWAEIHCFAPRGAPPQYTIPLNPQNISTGIDAPIGTILYDGRWIGPNQANDAQRTICRDTSPRGAAAQRESTHLVYNIAVEQAPLRLVNWTSGPYANAVYETGIPGIGVVIIASGAGGGLGKPLVKGGTPMQLGTIGLRNSTSMMADIKSVMSGQNLRLLLIKTGSLRPGRYHLNSIVLPRLKIYLDNHPAANLTAGLPIEVAKIQYQGNLAISTASCRTPNLTVNMRKHNAPATFTGVGSASPWVDFAIYFTDCNVFYGHPTEKNPFFMFNYPHEIAEQKIEMNIVNISFKPLNGIIDADKGILALEKSDTSASGIGIQLVEISEGEKKNLTKLGLRRGHFYMHNSHRSSYERRMSARYIQVDERVTPGSANAQVMFTVTYD